MRTLAAALIIGSVVPLTACQATQQSQAAITPGKTKAAELAAIKQPERRREAERVSVEARVTKLGGGEADVHRGSLAAGSRRVAQRALQERTEHVADAGSGSADADRRETGTDDLGRCEFHDITPFNNWLRDQ